MNYTQRKRKALNEIDTEEVRTSSGIPYLIFTNTPKALELKKEHEGKRVWISSYPRTTKAHLIEFRGDEVKVSIRGGVDRDFYSTEVILHPSEWKGHV